MSLKEKAIESLGDLFIFGFKGISLEASTKKWISDKKIGGVLLFEHNYQDPIQLLNLINQIQNLRTDLPLWVSVDYEGGRVQRFKKGFTKIPSAASIGAKNSSQLAFDVSQVIATELKAVGVNLNFFPVADIATNLKNPVIGDRSYGSSDEIVSRMVNASLSGHYSQSIQACIKHFPGHGDTTVDSHYELPFVNHNLEILEKREFKPFLNAFQNNCSFLMTAHILFSKIDSKFPATFSKKILKEILREKLGYNGIIISDDLEMKAVTNFVSFEEIPCLAIDAGCNLLIYRTEEAAKIAWENLKNSIQKGYLDPKLVLDSSQKNKSLKRKCLPIYKTNSIELLKKTINTIQHHEIINQIKKDIS